MSFREVHRRLLRAGFFEVGQVGSQIKFAKIMDHGTITATVPKHREVASGTLRSIVRQIGISEADFMKL